MTLLNKLEKLAPHWFIALIAIVVAIFVVILYKPPYEFCESQRKMLIKSQAKFLANKNYYDVFLKNCLAGNSRGACEPYFGGFDKLIKDLEMVEPHCKSQVASGARTKTALIHFLIYVPQLAWGAQGPPSVYTRASWLESRHLNIFCRVKTAYKSVYGEAAYKAVEKKALSLLPDEKKLSEERKKERSLFATPCYQYK